MIRTTRFLGIPTGAVVMATATQGGLSDSIGPIIWGVAPMPTAASAPGGVMIADGGASPGAAQTTTTSGGVMVHA